MGNSHSYDYILASGITTRAQSNVPDTLAYIINYPDNGGFAIIATDTRVYPILAYANTGNFNTDNEAVNDNFIDCIENYIADGIENDNPYNTNDISLETCYIMSPRAGIGLHQNAPYNKYVEIEHPGYPAGCVPVAAALVLTHTKWAIFYHDITFYCSAITNAIRKGSKKNIIDSKDNSRKIVGGEEHVYTYDEAIDNMAKIIYWIGKDINISHELDPQGNPQSKAKSDDVFTLFKEMGLNLQSEFETYNIEEIASHITNHCMVYLRGQDGKKMVAHAWVCDGVQYCYDKNDESKIINIMLHCDWGWGGQNNGYYNGSVFNADNYNFRVTKYFAVKSEVF